MKKSRSEKTNSVIRLLPCLYDAEIARQVDVTREYVRQIRKKQKVPRPKGMYSRCGIMSEEMLGEALRVIDETNNVAEAARRIGVCDETLAAYLERYEVPIDKDRIKVVRRTNGDASAEMTELLKHGKSPSEVAQILKKDYSAVYIHGIKAGLIKSPQGVCTLSSCDVQVYAKGLCRNHYERQRRLNSLKRVEGSVNNNPGGKKWGKQKQGARLPKGAMPPSKSSTKKTG